MLKKDELEHSSFVIAEVGNNHQGKLETAREYIRVFATLGADAIKFQTRNNKYLFSESGYAAPYNGDNSFASTYGEHRELLELKPEWLPILKEDCEKFGAKFMSTPFDEPSLDLVNKAGVDLIKIASFDLGNLPFLKKIAATGLPIVMSCGGGKAEHIRASFEQLRAGTDQIAILHCVSEYPCDHNRLGLNNLDILKAAFPECVIGLSDHFTGILSGPVAYMKGARVFEKHVTLNRAWKGTDHGFSLEPEGFRKFIRDIKRVPEMMPPKPEEELGDEFVFKKLGKSLVALRDIKEGEKITVDDLTGRIYSNEGIPVRQSLNIIGRIATRHIVAGELIAYEAVEDR
ncbi:N-acetylneuraminate synthase family protein [Cohaesibacter gelatinilyticus]|uniref:N-acetylneuraminate synthase/sialic acid synthase n=1 Tax=Cohaesibacter gelatinilyticus TaxID=372072 RepID=A0A285PFC0_9HYPH|nr:N-acetylneuraminate synthase family protein [Cohaesibacter gelatinilyticus]SNZ20138.1 N-acetylneuraminate synthase/sialic acid synthase [Cohaesibacter gelatinilyticus]